MNRSIGFFILMLVALVLAGVVTWSLLNPKEAEGYYGLIGSVPNSPENKAIGEGVVHFEKTEDETNG